MAPTEEGDRQRTTGKSFAPYLSGLVALVFYVVFLYLVTFYWESGWILPLFRTHYAFFVGLPFAGLLAHFLVGTMENTRGKIELELLGLKFKGASGPIIMWVLVFLAIVLGIRLIWPLQP